MTRHIRLFLWGLVVLAVLAVPIFEHFRADRSISTPNREDSASLEPQGTRDKLLLDARRTETLQLPPSDQQAWQEFKQWLDHLDQLGRSEELTQRKTSSPPTQGDVRFTEEAETVDEAVDKYKAAGVSVSADSGESSERQLLIAEIEQRIEALSLKYEELDEEYAALPPHELGDKEQFETLTREEMARDNALAARRRDLTHQILEIQREKKALRRRLRELQDEQ